MEKANQEPFKKYLGLSIIGHVGLIALFTLKIVFSPSEDLIIHSAIRVDMVALPDKQVPSSPKIEEKKTTPVNIEQDKKVPTPKVKINKIKMAEKIQNQALAKLAAMSAMDKLKAEVENQKHSQAVEKPQLYKGNVISKGSDLKGLSKLQYDEYFAKLEVHVKEYWILPQWLADANLKAQVKVRIDDKGYITSKEIINSSGNNVFDAKALETMDKASPCPIAPSHLQTLIANEGIIFNFP